jgi:hypothetical protein
MRTAELVQDAAEIEMGDGVVGVAGNGAEETGGRAFQVTLFVRKHAEIDQCLDVRRVYGQNAAVGLDRLGMRFGIGLVLQGEGKPIADVAFGHDANFVAEFAGIEIQHKLAGDGFEVCAVVVDDNVAAVGENAEFRERLLDL